MLESSPSVTPTLAELGAEEEILEGAIAALEETLGQPDLGAEREKTERELAGLQCQLAQLGASSCRDPGVR